MENELNFDTGYDIVEPKEVFVDGDNNVVTHDDLQITPFDVIRTLAKNLGQTINDPNPKCKDCYGRGYTGRDSESKAPIPCLCIYPKEAETKNQLMFNRTRKLSRQERRKMKRDAKKQTIRGVN